MTAYSELLETLYAATLDESQWERFLCLLCEATRSAIAFLIRNDCTAGRRVLASGGSPPPEGEVGYRTADPVRDAFMRKPRSGVIEVEDFLPHRQLMASSVYPVMAKSGAHYGTCIVPELSMRRYELIAVWRVDRPRLEPELAEMLHLLLPHIQTAFRIQRALGMFAERAQTAEAMLDASPTASLLLNACGQVVYQNASARRLVGHGGLLAARDGRLAPREQERCAEFEALVTAAASQWDHPGGAMLLRRTEGRQPLHLLVSPFRLGTQRAGRARRVLVLATDPDHGMPGQDAVLRQLYELTRAEVEVAHGLQTGYSAQEMAAIRGVSVGTVRSQIKSVLAKTGTRRQVDLVRLLCTLPRVP